MDQVGYVILKVTKTDQFGVIGGSITLPTDHSSDVDYYCSQNDLVSDLSRYQCSNYRAIFSVSKAARFKIILL